MASLIQYDSLNAMPAPPAQPTAAQLQAAKDQFDRAKVGDGQPLPPPFTYGKIWVPPYNRGPVDKVPKAPSMSATELKQLMKDLPKPETQLQLPAPPIGGIPVPGRPADPTTFLQLARASINQKRYAKTWRRLGKRLNVRGITRATNQRQRRDQDNYNLLIELSTNVTGKHTIFYSTRMTQQTGTVGPVTQNQAQQEGLGLQASFDFPEIPRTDKTPPYSQPRDKKNEKWMDLSTKLDEWLKQHFHKGNELAMPNPLYPKQTKFDKIFRISDFQWKYLPKSLDNLTGKNPPFKFYITNNRTNNQDPNMYIVLNVRLIGRFRKGNKINPKRALPVAKVNEKKGKIKKAASFCGNQLSNIKTIALDKYHSAPGLFTDSQSEKFEKQMKKAVAADVTSKNIKLYYENRKTALDYWEQEYYCRQAMNFNAGHIGGWPNVNAASTRFPFDPWTLQPAVALTSKLVTYPNGLPGQAPNGESNAAIPAGADTIAMRTWYGAQPAGFQRPAWPLPFSPFGMSLKPNMVLVLFKRMNNYLNTPAGGAGIGAPPAPVGAAIGLLQPLRVQGKLPDLTTVTWNDAQWNALFTLYEYVLYNRFEASEPEFVLEPYEPYPRLPAPAGGAEFGTWLISRNRRQYAIPVNTGVEPWVEGAGLPALPGIIPAVASRPRVSWRQVKANGFYKIEAKKWAEWMVLSNPFPIPGFPIYSSYIALFQKYKYYKLHAASTIPQPTNVLAAGQEATNCSLPPANITFSSSFRDRGEWILPSEANRTAQYINPYSAVALVAPAAPPGWLPTGYLDLINAQPSNGKWLFGGPSPGKYPKEMWPKNNMRIHGAIPPVRYPPLEDVIKINVRRSKRKNLGGWQGGRKKRTLRRRKKTRRNKTLKRRSKRKKS